MQVEQQKGEWTHLPITEHRDDIIKAIKSNEVVVIEGETGCGKTTQVPKYILNAQPDSKIIVTQPRRLAAVMVANRVAYETNSKLGERVGYHIGMDCRATDKTKITYVTNGIFLQKLTNDPDFLKSYTHFIFDEIHERGLQCDFSLIAMKLYLCRRKAPRAKIILMSATLNSEMFSKFFAKDPQGNFIKSRIIEERDERVGRPNRGRQPRGEREQQPEQLRQWKYTTKLDITQKDKPAQRIKLPTMRKYSIIIKYLEDVEPKYHDTGNFSDQPDLDDRLLETAVKVVSDSYKSGDILIFMPGMREIKRMSDSLERFRQKCNIIELHSQFSEGASEQLFSKDPKPKIIISTNIAESSITLPDCRTVIDFCLSKQNNYDERTRFQRLELKWASLASLTQRAGRVGRVSDGTVVRLISKRHLDSFSQYEPPEIRRSPLEKTILQIKKLEKLDTGKQKSENSIFSDPYEVLSNAFEPPEIGSINMALKRLVDEGALAEQNDDDKEPAYRHMKYNGANLKITTLGELLVQIPCDIQLAKALLLSMQLSCLPMMLNVAAIIYSTKPFFVNSEKRQQPEQYIHTIVDYDRQRYNDFRIRHRIFDSWSYNFFEPWYQQNVSKFYTKKKIEDLDDEDQNFYKIENGRVVNYSKLLNEFQRFRANSEQIRWCTLRCIYANNMREILLFRQSLQMKITRGKMNFREDFIKNPDVLDLALNICLFSAFRDSLMLIESTPDDSGINSITNQNLMPAYTIDVDFPRDNHAKEIENYIKPEVDKKMKVVQMSKSFFMETSFPILSKFMLPYRHRGRLNGKSSEVFRLLFNKQPYYPFKMRVKDLRNRTEVRIDNDSINGFIPHRGIHEGYLLSNGYFESRTSVSTSCTAYLSAVHTALLLMIFGGKCVLLHHDSHEFFNRMKVQGYTIPLPFFLEISTLKQIQKLKEHIKEIFELGKRGPMNEELMRDFRGVLDQQYEQIPEIDRYWQQLHIEERVKQVQLEPSCSISDIEFRPVLERNNYHNDFREWRTNKLSEFEKYVNKLRFETSKFICKECHPHKTTVLCEAESCDPNKKVFKYNPYEDSWHVQGKQVMCSMKKHRIGRLIGEEEEVRIDEQRKVLLVYPDLSTEGFTFERHSLPRIRENQQRMMPDIRSFRKQAKNFECPFCIKDDYSFTARNLQEFMKHTRNKEHHRKIEEFTKALIQ